MNYLYLKTLHIVLVTSWFAGLFYLPRLFVNLAQEENDISYQRLILMSHKLYRFMTLLAVLALMSGIYLYILMGKQGAWMHAKLLLVVILCGYHHGCKKLLHKFVNKQNKRSHIFYRWYNEVPVILLILIVYCVVVKPF
jgi:protoporphyrinogen IX oxidase